MVHHCTDKVMSSEIVIENETVISLEAFGREINKNDRELLTQLV